MHTTKIATSLVAVAAILAGCSSAATAVPPTPAPASPTPAPASAAPSSASSAAPSGSAAAGLTVGSFDSSFSAMSQLTSVTSAGTGLVGVVMPDTTSSTRWVSFDAPYLTQAFTAAGYAATDFKVENAGGVDATQLSMAQADITDGAKVLVVAPIDSTVGGQIQAYAAGSRRGHDQLRPGHVPGHEHVLRQLRQRPGRRADRQGLHPVRHGLGRQQPQGLHRRWWPGHRSQRDRLRQGLQRRGLGPEGRPGCGGRHEPRRHDPGRRAARPGLEQCPGRHDLPAGLHGPSRRSTPRSRPTTVSPTP